MKQISKLENLRLLKTPRVSVQPVKKEEWDEILKLGNPMPIATD